MIINVFSWIREKAREAFILGVADAVDALDRDTADGNTAAASPLVLPEPLRKRLEVAPVEAGGNGNGNGKTKREGR